MKMANIGQRGRHAELALDGRTMNSRALWVNRNRNHKNGYRTLFFNYYCSSIQNNHNGNGNHNRSNTHSLNNHCSSWTCLLVDGQGLGTPQSLHTWLSLFEKTNFRFSGRKFIELLEEHVLNPNDFAGHTLKGSLEGAYLYSDVDIKWAQGFFGDLANE